MVQLFKVSNLLDDGLNKMGLLHVIQRFPQLFSHLFTFTGDVSADDVLAALYVDNEDTRDEVLMALTYKYIKDLSKEGMS